MKREWVDADTWLRYLRSRLGGSVPVDPPLLNFEEAAVIAEMGAFDYEHQSDGRTLIKVGADNAARAVAFVESQRRNDVKPS